MTWREADCPEGVRWFVDAFNAPSLDDAEIARAFAKSPRRLAHLKNSLLQKREIFGRFDPAAIDTLDDGLYVLTGTDARARPTTLRVRLDPERPHVIRSYAIYPTPQPGYTARLGSPADYAACARVEAQTPTQSGEGTYFISRGDGFGSYIELQKPAKFWVIEFCGEIVGWTAGALRSLKSPQPLVYIYAAQAYLLPSHRGSRSFMQASALLQEWGWEKADGAFYYMNVGNDRSQNFNRGKQYWSVPVCDLSIPANVTTSAKPGTAARADYPRIAALINAAHDKEAMFDPYDADTLSERLARCPAAYDAGQILISANAVLGVSAAHENIAHTMGNGEVRRTVAASVLDFGFDGEAGLRELGDLLSAASVPARARGVTHLSLLCSPSSPAFQALASRADNIDHYLMSCVDPEPADLALRGLYADHIYF